MNDRVLNEKESLELIAQMIQNTKSRMTRNSGAPFLIWGYTTIIVSLLVWFLLKREIIIGNGCGFCCRLFPCLLLYGLSTNSRR